MSQNQSLLLMHTSPDQWLRRDLVDRLRDIHRQNCNCPCGPSQTSRNRRYAESTTLKEAMSCLVSMERENARLMRRNKTLRLEARKQKREIESLQEQLARSEPRPPKTHSGPRVGKGPEPQKSPGVGKIQEGV